MFKNKCIFLRAFGCFGILHQAISIRSDGVVQPERWFSLSCLAISSVRVARSVFDFVHAGSGKGRKLLRGLVVLLACTSSCGTKTFIFSTRLHARLLDRSPLVL